MNNVSNKLLEGLISEIKTQSDFDELRDQLLKRGVETLLKAEMTAHLGYEQGQQPVSENIRNGYSKKRLKTQSGEIGLSIPRDRAGSFAPVSLPKHSTMTRNLEEQIILLYSKGMSNSDIVDGNYSGTNLATKDNASNALPLFLRVVSNTDRIIANWCAPFSDLN